MLTVYELPRDAHGLVQGAWRLLHASPSFNGEIGTYTMRDGASVLPACGRALERAVAFFGADLYLEPWGALPPGFTCGEMIEHPLPASIAWTPEPCPWRTAPAAQKAAPALPAVLRDTLPPPPPEEPAEAAAPDGDVSLDDMDRDALEALAAELDVKVDGRWGDSKLRRAIRFAQR